MPQCVRWKAHCFVGSFLSVFSFWTPIMWMLVCLMLSQRSLRLSAIFFSILFSLLHFVAAISAILSSRSLLCSCASVILLSVPCSVLLISDLYFFQGFVKQLLHLLHSFPNPGSSSLSLFWILFLEGCLSLLHLAVFLGFCPFIWNTIFCLFILINFLWCGFHSGGWYCSSSCFFCLPSGGWG